MKTLKMLIATVLVATFVVPAVQAEVVTGNPSGKITIVEYYDYNCPHCRTMSSVVDKMQHDKNVRVARRVMAMMSPESMYAAKAVLASRKQGEKKYEKFNELLMSQHRFITRDIVMRLATEAGLDVELLGRHMQNPAIAAEIRANMSSARSLDIHLVPTTLVMRTGDTRKTERFTGKVSYSRIKNAVTDLL